MTLIFDICWKRGENFLVKQIKACGVSLKATDTYKASHAMPELIFKAHFFQFLRAWASLYLKEL